MGSTTRPRNLACLNDASISCFRIHCLDAEGFFNHDTSKCMTDLLTLSSCIMKRLYLDNTDLLVPHESSNTVNNPCLENK